MERYLSLTLELTPIPTIRMLTWNQPAANPSWRHTTGPYPKTDHCPYQEDQEEKKIKQGNEKGQTGNTGRNEAP
jgi:hypothetical protein